MSGRDAPAGSVSERDIGVDLHRWVGVPPQLADRLDDLRHPAPVRWLVVAETTIGVEGQLAVVS